MPVPAGIRVVEAASGDDIADCRALFEEYQAGLGVSLCFQGFAQELATLPGNYARPEGRLFLARRGAEPVGCVAVRTIGPGEGEIKRLYVRESARGCGLGEALAGSAVAASREIGHRVVKLDTLPTMRSAQALYARLGFRDTAPYNDNPIAGVRFMALALD